MILGGPNGAGKTTVAGELVPADIAFLNSDVIATGLLRAGHGRAGVELAAGRVLLAQVREAVATGRSFCLETTLAGHNVGRLIAQWQTAGYRVRLVFIALFDPTLAVTRVADRVADGGHDVPEPVVRRRWAAGLRSLFDVCLPLVDTWSIFDNSDAEPRLVAAGTRAQPAPEVTDALRWTRLVQLATDAGALNAPRDPRRAFRPRDPGRRSPAGPGEADAPPPV